MIVRLQKALFTFTLRNREYVYCVEANTIKERLQKNTPFVFFWYGKKSFFCLFFSYPFTPSYGTKKKRKGYHP